MKAERRHFLGRITAGWCHRSDGECSSPRTLRTSRHRDAPARRYDRLRSSRFSSAQHEFGRAALCGSSVTSPSAAVIIPKDDCVPQVRSRPSPKRTRRPQRKAESKHFSQNFSFFSHNIASFRQNRAKTVSQSKSCERKSRRKNDVSKCASSARSLRF